MKVTVIGKEYVAGKSKRTGKEFSANVVHVAHNKNGVEGQAVDTIWLDPMQYPLSGIAVGKPYEVDRDGRGFIIDFAPVR